MKKFWYSLLVLGLTLSVLSGCSGVNPTAPQAGDSSQLTSQAIASTETLTAVAVFPYIAQFESETLEAVVIYDSSTGRMTSISISNKYGPATTRRIQAQVRSQLTNYFATPPVPLVNALGRWGTYTATLKIGFHADGNIIYLRQVNQGYTNIFCYYINSQTPYSSRITRYPMP
ncbi:MAG: hypothetical protein AB1439_03520 [candidate division FCPU426 bacterium]